MASSGSVAPHGDLPLEEFTRHADRLSRWIAATLGSPERYPVLARVAPGDVARSCRQRYRAETVESAKRAPMLAQFSQ